MIEALQLAVSSLVQPAATMVHQRRPYGILGWNPNVDIASSVLAVDNSQDGDLQHPGMLSSGGTQRRGSQFTTKSNPRGEEKMTNRIIVATFNNTNSAYDAASAIKNLKDSGVTQFKLKAGVMVKKDDRGNVSLVEDRERPLLGTAVGTAAGALIGLIAGAPGAAMGAALGATTGLGGDAVMAALDSDFIDTVTAEMRPGMTAIVVEADEGSTRTVDDIVTLGGGHVFRQAA